jgi:hypothetical protein
MNIHPWKRVGKFNCNKPHPHPNFSWLPWITIASPQICLGLESPRSLTQLCVYPLIQLLALPPKPQSKSPWEGNGHKNISFFGWENTTTFLSLDEKTQLHSFLWMRKHDYIPFFGWETTTTFLSLHEKPQKKFLWMKNLNCISFFGWKLQLHLLWREPKNIHQGGQWKQLVHSLASVGFSNLTIIGVNRFLQTSFTKSLGQLLLVV